MSSNPDRVLARIHRRSGSWCERYRYPERGVRGIEKGCSSESGIMGLKQEPNPGKGAPNRCYHATTPTVSVSSFDDHRLVANAGLILPATLALHLGLPQLVRMHLDLGDVPGRANTGDKMMTLVASALAGGDCIDDADVLRTGGTACALGCVVKAPSTLGDLPAQLPVGACPPAGPGEPPVAGPGLGRWGRPRRLAPDHRPGLDHLRDLRSGQGGGRATTATPAPVAITRYWPLPPAPARC